MLEGLIESISLMINAEYERPHMKYYIVDEFEWKQRARNPLLIKIKQLRKELKERNNEI